MSFSISKQAFSHLDVNNNKEISFSELKKLDRNQDQEISKEEASAFGITSSRDVSELNGAIKYYQGLAPREIVFPDNRTSLNPTDFSDPKSQELIAKYNLHSSKGQTELEWMEYADSFDSLKGMVLKDIRDNNTAIKQYSERFSVNPNFLAAIIFEEQMHLNPPVIEDAVVGLLDRLGIKDNTSVGPGQLGVGELIKQGFYESEGIPKSGHPNDLNKTQVQKGIKYLSHIDNGIKVLAKQIARIKSDLGYSTQPLDLDSFQGQRAAAWVSYIHNGYADYPSRVLDYAQDGYLKGAISYIEQKQPAYTDILPHML